MPETKKPEALERRVMAIDDIELRVTDDDNPKITGYAAKFNKWSLDLGGFREKIDKGAFDEAMKISDVRALKNHDPNLLLGRSTSGTLRLNSNAVGLKFEIDPPDTSTGRDTVTEIKRKDITGCSFSFTTAEDDWKYLKDGSVERTIIRVGELFDCGPVTFPAYPDTTVAARSLERVLGEHTAESLGGETELVVVKNELEERTEPEVPVADEATDEVSTEPELDLIDDERMRKAWVSYRKLGRMINRFKQANA